MLPMLQREWSIMDYDDGGDDDEVERMVIIKGDWCECSCSG
jgi:hypothetical protein